MITLDAAFTAARRTLATVTERAERQDYYSGARTDIINPHAELRAALDMHALRARIHAHFADLHTEREAIDRQLTGLASDTRHGNDTDLLDELPELAGRLADLPARLQALLFAALDIQILWNPPMRQATFFATITDTTPGIVAALLARAGDDDPTATDTAPATDGNAATSSDAFSGLSRLPYPQKTRPQSQISGSRAAAGVKCLALARCGR